MTENHARSFRFSADGADEGDGWMNTRGLAREIAADELLVVDRGHGEREAVAPDANGGEHFVPLADHERHVVLHGDSPFARAFDPTIAFGRPVEPDVMSTK